MEQKVPRGGLIQDAGQMHEIWDYPYNTGCLVTREAGGWAVLSPSLSLIGTLGQEQWHSQWGVTGVCTPLLATFLRVY